MILLAVGSGRHWPPLEVPPRQGEAVDVIRQNPPMHAEVAMRRLIREPQNTWSNLAFVLGGAWLLTAAQCRSSRAAGIALTAVGVGSFLYHASASRELRHLDVGAMYWLFLLLGVVAPAGVFAAWRRRVEPRIVMITVATLGTAVALTCGRNLSIAGVKPFALTTATAVAATIVIASLVLIAWRSGTRSRWLAVAGTILLFAAALVCQIGDRPGGWLFNPAARLQAHALWHVLSAMAVTGAVAIGDRA
ncbi:MAG: ceramidase domain-containing protein [Verrucomicrobiota bacterium]